VISLILTINPDDISLVILHDCLKFGNALQ